MPCIATRVPQMFLFVQHRFEKLASFNASTAHSTVMRVSFAIRFNPSIRYTCAPPHTTPWRTSPPLTAGAEESDYNAGEGGRMQNDLIYLHWLTGHDSSVFLFCSCLVFWSKHRFPSSLHTISNTKKVSYSSNKPGPTNILYLCTQL
jgi:hypothetical protein